jgi:hypothetical protein
MSTLRVFQRLAAGCGIAALGCAGPADGSPGADYESETSRARLEIAETPELRVWALDLGEPAPGANVFYAAVKNRTGQPVTLSLDLRASPGLWLLPNWQRQSRIELHPYEVRLIEAPYEFTRMSVEGALRVRFGRVMETSRGEADVDRFFEESYRVGAGNPAALSPADFFDSLATAHLDIYAWRGSVAAGQMQAIGGRREAALEAIADELGVTFPDRVRLVFYPDSATKTDQTGHVGAGWAWGNNIIEIYNDLIRLDPYHELAHVVARRLGDPPALLSEGFATYVSERLGADALEFLGHPGLTADQVACESAGVGGLIPLDTLFGFTEIGSQASNPPVAYPQAASFVKFLVERYGIDTFRDAYRMLASTDEPAGVLANEEAFAAIYGATPGGLERSWRQRIGCPVSFPRARAVTPN